MKTVKWCFEMKNAHCEGSFEIEDDTPAYEIDSMVIDEVLSLGLVSYNWSVSEEE